MWLVCHDFMSMLLFVFGKVSAARFWWKRYEEEGNFNTKPHTGRPEVLSPEQKQDIVNRVEQDPFSTAVSFAREYGVSEPTVSSVLKKTVCVVVRQPLKLNSPRRTVRNALHSAERSWKNGMTIS